MVDLKPGRDREKGHAAWEGSDWFSDIFEETDELRWPLSMPVFNRMRRQSAQIAAVNRAWMLPVLATPWYVRQGPARREVAVNLARDLGLPLMEESGELATEETRPLRRKGRFSWRQHVELALLHKIYGHMVFEQVYEYLTRAQGGDGLAHLKKLAPRMPHTITHWEIASDGGLKWIKQAKPWGAITSAEDVLEPGVKLEVDRLVVYVNEKEGANWHGTSILRPVYMPYKAKDRLYRLGLITAERASGIALYEGSEGAAQGELDRGLEMAKAWRTGEESSAAVPHGAALYFGGIRGTLYDPLPMLQHLSMLESRNMMAQFLNLGDSETGSRALGEAFVDFFTLALQGVLGDLTDIAQPHVVEDWVDVNYGTAEPAPEVFPGDVGGRPQVMAEAVTTLMANGAITYDEELEDWVRRGLGAPARSDKGRQPPTPPQPAVPPPQPTTTALAARRDPTDIELAARTDFARIDSTYQRLLRRALNAWRQVQGEQIRTLLDEVTRLVDDGNLGQLGLMEAPVEAAQKELRAVLGEMVTEAVDEAVREARRQGVKLKRPDIRAVRAAVEEQADAVAQLMGRGLSEKMGREAIRNASAGGLSGGEVAQRVSDSLDALTDQYLLDHLGGALTIAQNAGRARTFEVSGPGRYYGSELLDGATCSNCALVDGTEYATLSEGLAAYPSGGYHECLGGFRCRGTLVKVHDEVIPSEVAEAA